MLYLPLLGWALFIAPCFAWVCRRLAQTPELRWAPSSVAIAIPVLLGIAALWAKTQHENNVVERLRNTAPATHAYLGQVQALLPVVRPGSRIYVARSPFEGWDAKFIIELLYHDRTVTVWLASKGGPLSAEELGRMDYVLDFENHKVRLVGGRNAAERTASRHAWFRRPCMEISGTTPCL
jgi:hypothetical protein